MLDTEGLVARANDAAQAGEFAQAAALFRQAQALDPRRADVLEPLAQCLLEMDDAEKPHKTQGCDRSQVDGKADVRQRDDKEIETILPVIQITRTST